MWATVESVITDTTEGKNTMLNLYTYLVNRTGEERGAVAIEYALLALLVAVALAVAFTALEGSISSALGAVGTALGAAAN